MPPEIRVSPSSAVAARPASVECTDGAVFEAVFDRLAASIYRYLAVRTGDAHLADDLMQQLWLQSHSRAAAVPAGGLEPWLRAIARNLVRTHWRVKARRPALAAVADPSLAADLADRLGREELPSGELERRELRDQLLLAITALPTADQELIIGHYFQQLPHAALGRSLSLSERAVEGRLYRARQALRQQLHHLDENDIDPLN